MYVALAFFLSYAGLFGSWILMPQEASYTVLASYYGIFFTVLGPTLAAIIVCLSYEDEGKDQLKAIWWSLKPSLSQVYLYLLLPSFSLLYALLVISLAGPDFAYLLSALGHEWEILLAHAFLQIFMVGILEETGWRGWMLPHLCQKFHLAKATIILAVIWGLWHFPKLFGPLSVSGPFIILGLATSVILSFLWFSYQGNLFLLAIAHGSINFPVFYMENLSERSYFGNGHILTAWLLYSLGFVFFAILLIVRQPGMWLAKATN
jgi:membrane protease YdiL (CAAX protease family)